MVKTRLDPGIIYEIEFAVQHASNGFAYLLLDKINILKRNNRFRNFSEETLIRIADALLVSTFSKDEELDATSNRNLYAFILCSEGKIQVSTEKNQHVLLLKNYLFYPDFLISGMSSIKFKALENTTIYSIDNETLYTLMFDYADFMDLILDLMNNYKKLVFTT